MNANSNTPITIGQRSGELCPQNHVYPYVLYRLYNDGITSANYLPKIQKS